MVLLVGVYREYAHCFMQVFLFSTFSPLNFYGPFEKVTYIMNTELNQSHVSKTLILILPNSRRPYLCKQ